MDAYEFFALLVVIAMVGTGIWTRLSGISKQLELLLTMLDRGTAFDALNRVVPRGSWDKVDTA